MIRHSLSGVLSSKDQGNLEFSSAIMEGRREEEVGRRKEEMDQGGREKME